MARLFHFSDTHLGHQQYPRTGPDGLNVRETDLYLAFRAVVDRAVEERPDAVVHAGDLFDGVRPSNRALAQALDGFLALDRAGIPTILIAGNHEHPKMRETGSPFRLFEHLPNVHPVYRGRRETVQVETPEGPLRIHAVPQCASNEALAAEVGGIEAGQDGHDVLVLHGAVHHLDAFRNAEFNELTLDTRWFDDRFAYVALGHYHGVHEIAENAWYCGAPERVSMAESGERKGFLDVSLGDRAEVRFRALPGRPYADLPRIDGTGLDTEGVETAVRDAVAGVPEGAVVRLVLEHLDPTLRGVLDVRRLRALGDRALHFDLRLDWQDTEHRVRGAAELHGLAEEFEAYAASHPVEGLDRARLLRRARAVLSDSPASDPENPEAPRVREALA